MLPELDTYDWGEAFYYAGSSSDNWPHGGGKAPTSVAGRPKVDESPVARIDVAEIVAMREGQNDGPPWLGVFRLHDGRYMFLEAGCDYTGWDCRADGFAHVAASLNDLVRFGLTPEHREALGLPLVGDERGK